MPLRIVVLCLIVLVLSGYAWRNWFNALIGAITLFAFLEHPDMPRSILGIPGCNFWNLLFANITLAWLNQRRAEGLEWDCPRPFKIALVCYISIIFISFARAFVDPTPYYLGTRFDILLAHLINPMKFLLPGLLLYDGCRTRERIILALAAILSVYFLLALQTVKAMGLQFDLSSGDELQRRAGRILDRSVGYQRIDLSMMCAGASWSAIAFARYFSHWHMKAMLWGASGVILLGQAVTGGRTGYATWVLVGLAMCIVKWRKLLPLVPVAIIVILAFIPAIRERMLSGFSSDKGGLLTETNTSEITSGRTDLWPHVIEEIGKAPLVGYGRVGFVREGIAEWNFDNYGEWFNHPHNAYLEMLLDNGILGSLFVVPIYFLLLRMSLRLFLDRGNVIYEVAGGVALPLLLSLFIAAIGAQTFYPREGVVVMWAALAVALRVWVFREASLENELMRDDETSPDSETGQKWEPSLEQMMSIRNA